MPKVVTPELAPQREEALVGVGIELRVADAGLHASDHAWMPIQVSDLLGREAAVVALEARARGSGSARSADHPAGRGQDADVGEALAQPRAGVSGTARRRGGPSPGRRAAARSSATTSLGIVDVQEQVARGARPGGRVRWLEQLAARAASRSSVTCHVDLAVVGGDEQRRVDASPARPAPAATRWTNSSLDGPCRWPAASIRSQ